MAWEQLQDVAHEAAAVAEDEKTRPPLACPIDGTALQPAPDGGLFCPWDGWRPT